MAVSIDVQRKILSSFEGCSGLYEDFCRTLGGLLESLMRPQAIQMHAISYRVKSIESLAGKITRPEKSYLELQEITDLAGVRITTYFAGDVDRVAEVLSTEFLIDLGSSVDKRKYVDPDRFGYRSLHYVVALNESRSSLREYARFKGLKCEIQIRSILQHAWAEIEHDLGYKSAAGVPAELRRKFARIASLLELADEEFGSIRDALVQYEKLVPEKIKTSPQSVDLDLPSIRALYSLPSAATSLDEAVVEAGNFLYTSKTNLPGSLVERFHFFGIQTIDSLEKVALSELGNVKRFTRYWVGDKSEDDKRVEVSIGVGLFYLFYVLLWREGDRSRALKYFYDYSIGVGRQAELVDRLLAFSPVVD